MNQPPPRVALIDYSMGNLRSVAKALEKTGAHVRWINEPSRLDSFDAMVLPGVGSFGAAVNNLKKQRLFSPIQKWVEKGKPFLGICLGYQLLFEKSEEAKGLAARGLGLLKGKVVRFPNMKNLKVPHLGWNQVYRASKDFFKEIKEGSYFYFVHSYFPVPKDTRLVATQTDYGVRFASSVMKNHLFACQFHPEKSGEVGLRLLKSFIKEVKSC